MAPIGAALAPLFADLQLRSRAALDLTEQVRAALPGEEKEHVVATMEKEGTLIVLADSAAWCPRIRYAQATLLQNLKVAGVEQFTKVKVRVGRSKRPNVDQTAGQ